MANYVLHLDDSGTKEYAAAPADYGSGNTRHFVFGGPLLTVEKESELAQQVRKLKKKTFGSYGPQMLVLGPCRR